MAVLEDKLLVVGGLSSDRTPLNSVEVLDLSGSDLDCPASDYDFAVEGAVANFAVEYR